MFSPSLLGMEKPYLFFPKNSYDENIFSHAKHPLWLKQANFLGPNARKNAPKPCEDVGVELPCPCCVPMGDLWGAFQEGGGPLCNAPSVMTLPTSDVIMGDIMRCVDTICMKRNLKGRFSVNGASSG